MTQSELHPGANTVHVWNIDLRAAEDRIRIFFQALSQDEQRRAQRFYSDKDARRFIAARAALRIILARYLNIAPQCLTFSYGIHGKPELAWNLKGSRIEFNLSHSSDAGFLAVAQGLRIGADIEFIDPAFAREEIAWRFFSGGEVRILQSLPATERAEAFFSCWTRKEAYIKALGLGLSLPLSSFDVAFGPGVRPALLRSEIFAEEQSRWSVYDVAAPPGFKAAVVVEGKEHQLHQREWSAEMEASQDR